MNLHALVVIILRLLSLHLVLNFVADIAPLLPNAIQSFLTAAPLDRVYLLNSLLAAAISIGAAGALWVGAHRIATYITRGLPQQLDCQGLTLSNLYSVLFLGVGLLTAVQKFPSVLTASHHLLKQLSADRTGTLESSQVAGAYDPFSGYQIAATYLSFFIGIILIVNGRTWAVALAKKDVRATRNMED